MSDRRLRVGDVVEVRSAAEILGTLDENGELDSAPFMPEMLPYVGGRFRVAGRALKVCTPVGNTHLERTVFLEQLRCDGSTHGGCEAECRIYWKESWLRLVNATADAGGVSAGSDATDRLEGLARSNVRQLRVLDGVAEEVYRCQATEAVKAQRSVDWREPTQYVRELTSGNVGPRHFARVMFDVVSQYLRRKLRRSGELPIPVAGADRVDGELLGLQPGEWVEVRALGEIALTLNDEFKHRGLGFHAEMAQHAGKRFRVRRRLKRLIDEPTGRMIEMKRDMIALEGLVCTGDNAWTNWFCRRELYPYWREAWLRRVNPPEVENGSQTITDGRT